MAPNRCQFTPIFGAEVLSAPIYALDKCKIRKCSAPIEAPGAQTRKCATQAPPDFRGRYISKVIRAPNRIQFTPNSGTEVLSDPLYAYGS